MLDDDNERLFGGTATGSAGRIELRGRRAARRRRQSRPMATARATGPPDARERRGPQAAAAAASSFGACSGCVVAQCLARPPRWVLPSGLVCAATATARRRARAARTIVSARPGRNSSRSCGVRFPHRQQRSRRRMSVTSTAQPKRAASASASSCTFRWHGRHSATRVIPQCSTGRLQVDGVQARRVEPAATAACSETVRARGNARVPAAARRCEADAGHYRGSLMNRTNPRPRRSTSRTVVASR